MYAINEDKSFFNLGTFGIMALSPDDFVPGAMLSDATMAAKLAGKYVRVFPTSGWPIAEIICKAVSTPCLFWDVIHYQNNTYTGFNELDEKEQENAELVDAVFFSNDNIYIVLENKPTAYMYVRIKGE